VARLTENKAIDTDRRWEPTISMGDGHTTTDADVDVMVRIYTTR